MSKPKYRSWEWHRGRWNAYTHPYAVNRPMLSAWADGDDVMVVLSYGTPGADPVAMIGVDLAGTRLGNLVQRACWWWYDRTRR